MRDRWFTYILEWTFGGLVIGCMTLSIMLNLNERRANFRALSSVGDGLNSEYFTLHPELKTNGPVYSATGYAEYVRKIFGITLQEAHKLAEEDWYLQGEINDVYHGFLVAALTTAIHESHDSLIHFREVTRDNCLQDNNGLAALGRQIATLENGSHNQQTFARELQLAVDLFEEQYRDQSNVLPDCSDISGEQTVSQIRSYRGHDNWGLMGINPLLGKAPFIDGAIFDVRRSVRFALKYLYGGYSKLARLFDQPQYGCLQVAANPNQLDPIALIRGAWSGQYNQQSISEIATCRFYHSQMCLRDAVTRAENNHLPLNENWVLERLDVYQNIAQNYSQVNYNPLIGSDCSAMPADTFFFERLISIVGQANSLYHQYLPEGSLERRALIELVSNFNNHQSNRTHINNLILTKYDEPSDGVIKYPKGSATSGFLGSLMNVIWSPTSFTLLDEDFSFFDYLMPFPIFEEEDFSHVFVGEAIKIRSEPAWGSDKVCTYWGKFDMIPAAVEVDENYLSDDFVRIRINSLHEYYPYTLLKRVCPGWDHGYALRDSIKKIMHVEIERAAQVLIPSVIVTNPEAFMSQTVGMTTLRDRIPILEEMTRSNGEKWYKTISRDGEIGWTLADNVLLE